MSITPLNLPSGLSRPVDAHGPHQAGAQVSRNVRPKRTLANQAGRRF